MNNRPIRIARVISRMNVGGPAWQVSVLTQGLASRGYDTDLLIGSVPDGEADFLAVRRPELNPIVVEGLGRSIRPLDDARALLRLVRHFRRERPLIVHTHTAKAGVLGRIAAVIARVPIRVHTFHGHLLHGYFSAWKVRLLILVERVLARFSTAVVAVGDQVRRDLVDARIGSRTTFTVIGPGVADVPQQDREALRAEWGVSLDSLVVLFVGRLTQIKRPDRLIEAHRQVMKRFPQALLVVVGEGDLLDETQRAATDIAPGVRFVGWRDDAPSLYGAADLVVLTSDNEGTPVSLIEAAMAGCPAVSTRVGSVAEVVDDGVTGLLCDTDPKEVANSICALLTDATRRRSMGVAARERARRLYSVDRLIADHDALYRELVAAL